MLSFYNRTRSKCVWLTEKMTEAQRTTLKKIPRHHVVRQLENGAVVVAVRHLRTTWVVIDVNGSIYDFRSYYHAIAQGA